MSIRLHIIIVKFIWLFLFNICFQELLTAHNLIPGVEYKIFQFPQDQMPRIDGDFMDWEMVPDSYKVDLSHLMDTRFGHGTDLDASDFNIAVKVGWVKDLNRLYFYVEAYDDFWDFESSGLDQDIFELVIDGDLSAGTFIKKHNAHIDLVGRAELHFKGHGSHAQNYHIFTPVQSKDPVMIWGNTPWIKDFPFFNIAYAHSLQPGDSGTFAMEFWVTPFDHASPDGPTSSIVSELKEGDLVAMSWCILEFDGEPQCESFMNLAHDTRMVYDASYLNLFRLMPSELLDPALVKADWAFHEIDRDGRWIQFLDRSQGEIDTWQWDFGDGTSSVERSPAHIYQKAGEWTVVLKVQGPTGESKRSKVWDVVTK